MYLFLVKKKRDLMTIQASIIACFQYAQKRSVISNFPQTSFMINNRNFVATELYVNLEYQVLKQCWQNYFIVTYWI